jgi:hypothetical protein
MTIPEAEAIARAGCPRCEQPIGEPCVYTLPRSPYYDDVTHWGSNRKQVERAGKPTAKVHQERRYVVFKLRRDEPHAISRGKAGRNEVEVLARLFDGGWHNEDEHWQGKWRGLNEAAQRCYQAGWFEIGGCGWQWRITDAGVAALKERS